jgi:hypothetical protein
MGESTGFKRICWPVSDTVCDVQRVDDAFDGGDVLGMEVEDLGDAVVADGAHAGGEVREVFNARAVGAGDEGEGGGHGCWLAVAGLDRMKLGVAFEPGVPAGEQRGALALTGEHAMEMAAGNTQVLGGDG